MQGEVVSVVLCGFPQASLGFGDQGLLLHDDGLVIHGLGLVVLLLVNVDGLGKAPDEVQCCCNSPHN